MGTVEAQPSRACAGCTACCFTHGVGEINKYEFSDCTNCEVGVGCKIYASRPRACGQFHCLWLTGDVGTDEERPDKLGIVCSPIYTRFTRDDPPAIFLFEAGEGAIEEAGGREFIRRLLLEGNALEIGTKNGHPRYQYHVLRTPEMLRYGEMLEGKLYRVIWHDP